MDISKVSSAIQSGLTGYKAVEQGVAEAAQNINRLNTERDRVAETIETNAVNSVEGSVLNQRESVSLEAEAVNLVVNEYLAKANINTIKTADEMLGSLVDTKV